MKRTIKTSSLLTLIAAVMMFFGADTIFAQDSLQVKNMNQNRYKKMMNNQGVKHGKGFVDENGDGINDNAPDADGDGIPNGQDPDFVRPQDGSGQKNGQMRGGSGNGRGFIDENGDGINDNAQDFDGDGIPNGQDPDYVRPQDGSGQKRGQMNKGGMRGGSGNGSGKGQRKGNQRGGNRPQ